MEKRLTDEMPAFVPFQASSKDIFCWSICFVAGVMRNIVSNIISQILSFIFSYQ